MGFDYNDAYKLPVWQRFWFINRLKEEFKQAKENNQSPTSSARSTNSGGRQIRNFLWRIIINVINCAGIENEKKRVYTT